MESPPDKGDLGGWVFHQHNLTRFFAQSRKQESSKTHKPARVFRQQRDLRGISAQSLSRRQRTLLQFRTSAMIRDCAKTQHPSFLRKRLCKKPSPSRVTCGKPLRVWLFYWVPAFAGTTNVGFLHSLESRNPVKRPNPQGFPASN